jgi:hypothetical protein
VPPVPACGGAEAREPDGHVGLQQRQQLTGDASGQGGGARFHDRPLLRRGYAVVFVAQEGARRHAEVVVQPGRDRFDAMAEEAPGLLDVDVVPHRVHVEIHQSARIDGDAQLGLIPGERDSSKKYSRPGSTSVVSRKPFAKW